MNHPSLRFWRNNRRLASLVMGTLLLIIAFPAYAKYEPKDRKQASGYSSGGGTRTGCKSDRSEERRVGKECRSRWSSYH